MEYFDYQQVAAEAGITPTQLAQIVESVRREFPEDLMLLELHVLRACRAIRDGRVTIEQVLSEPNAAEH